MHIEQLKVRATAGDKKAYTLVDVEVPDSVTEAVALYGEAAAYGALVKGLKMQSRVLGNRELRAQIDPKHAPRSTKEQFVPLNQKRGTRSTPPGRPFGQRRQA